jgi:hypothetical protein
LRSKGNEHITEELERNLHTISGTKGKSEKMLKMINESHNTIIPVMGLYSQ